MIRHCNIYVHIQSLYIHPFTESTRNDSCPACDYRKNIQYGSSACIKWKTTWKTYAYMGGMNLTQIVLDSIK
jgi:hypothetical protein